MGIFRHEDTARRRVALALAMAAHVERNIPHLFPQATTDRIELAADQLVNDEPLEFESWTVIARIRESLIARLPDRPWAGLLLDAFTDDDVDDLRPGP